MKTECYRLVLNKNGKELSNKIENKNNEICFFVKLSIGLKDWNEWRYYGYRKLNETSILDNDEGCQLSG